MSVIQKLTSVLPVGDDGLEVRTYECDECGHVFESTKTPDQAMCEECLSRELTAQ